MRPTTAQMQRAAIAVVRVFHDRGVATAAAILEKMGPYTGQVYEHVCARLTDDQAESLMLTLTYLQEESGPAALVAGLADTVLEHETA